MAQHPGLSSGGGTNADIRRGGGVRSSKTSSRIKQTRRFGGAAGLPRRKRVAGRGPDHRRRSSAPKRARPPVTGCPRRSAACLVEVREASPLGRLKATRPETYVRPSPARRPSSSRPPISRSSMSLRRRRGAPADWPSAAAREKSKSPYRAGAAAARSDYRPTERDLPCQPGRRLADAEGDFFERIQQKLTVGIYDFTSAHILSGLENALTSGGAGPRSVIRARPSDAQSVGRSERRADRAGLLKSDLGKSLSFAWAPVRSSPEVREWIFPSAYHIKVAVRDSAEMWLSSGNWNNSNQPEDAPLTDPDPRTPARP